MTRSNFKRLDFAAAAVLVLAASAAHAGPASEWRDIGEFQATASSAGLAARGLNDANGLGTTFDSSSWDAPTTKVASSTLTLDAQTAAASTDTGGRMRVLSVSNTAPVVGSPAALDLTLWNFVTNIRAQQASDPFVQLQTSAANIDYTLNAVPAEVPIPASVWLFAGGLAALLLARKALRRTRVTHALAAA